MNFKLKTSKEAQKILLDIRDKTGITPNILSRYALSIAINDENYYENFNQDSNGLEFNRNVLLGELDEMYKLLLINRENKTLNDEEYFPKYVKSYLEYGVRVMDGYSKLTKNYDTFIKAIIDSSTGGAII